LFVLGAVSSEPLQASERFFNTVRGGAFREHRARKGDSAPYDRGSTRSYRSIQVLLIPSRYSTPSSPFLCVYLLVSLHVDLLLGEVLELVRGVDGVGTLLPAGRADLTVLVGELEGLDDSDGLLDGSADGQVVDVRGSESTVGVDEEGASESDALLLEQDAVSLGNGVVSVSELGVSDRGSELAEGWQRSLPRRMCGRGADDR